MLTESLLAFGKSLKKYSKRVLEWLKAICGEAKSWPRSRWHSRGQRFDPAYLHQKDLKSQDFRSFSRLKSSILSIISYLFKIWRNSLLLRNFSYQNSYQNYGDIPWTGRHISPHGGS